MGQIEYSTNALEFLEEISEALSVMEPGESDLEQILSRVDQLCAPESAAFIGLARDRSEFIVLAANRTGGATMVGSAPVAPEEMSTGRARLESGCFPRVGTLLDEALARGTTIRLGAPGATLTDPVIEAVAGPGPIESGYVVPLRVSGVERGGLILTNPRRPVVTQGVLHDLSGFLDLAALAIDRGSLGTTRIAESTSRVILEALLRVITTGSSVEELIYSTVGVVLRNWRSELIEIATLEGDQLRYRYPPTLSRSSVQSEPSEGGERRHLSTLHHRAMEEGHLIELELGSGPDTGGQVPDRVVAIPLRSGAAVLGSLLLGRNRTPYSKSEKGVLQVVGNHLGAALDLTHILHQRAAENERLEIVLAESELQLKELRQLLDATKDKRTRVQSLASLGELAAGVAHDLNNALNPVVAFAELIHEHSSDPARVEMYADRILLAARGAAETVRRIQRFMRRRLSEVPAEIISVFEIVNQVVELTRPTWSKRDTGTAIVVEKEIDPQLRIQGNPGELRQGLLNLISNALDAMRRGGELRFVGRAEGGDVVLSIEDSGDGMPSEILDRALDPFFTTKGAHGTGLGLAEVYGIVQRHGGSLDIESEEGVGTRVILRLPRTETAVSPARERRRFSEATTNQQKILIVDDNLLSLEGTAAALRSAGHDVETAADARGALELFERGGFDLVLTDLELPDLHGLELVGQMRRLDPALRIGVLTGWNIAEEEGELQRLGVEFYFIKPVDTDELLTAL